MLIEKRTKGNKNLKELNLEKKIQTNIEDQMGRDTIVHFSLHWLSRLFRFLSISFSLFFSLKQHWFWWKYFFLYPTLTSFSEKKIIIIININNNSNNKINFSFQSKTPESTRHAHVFVSVFVLIVFVSPIHKDTHTDIDRHIHTSTHTALHYQKTEQIKTIY